MKADSVSSSQPTNRLWAKEWTNNEVGDLEPWEVGAQKEKFVKSHAEPAPAAPPAHHRAMAAAAAKAPAAGAGTTSDTPAATASKRPPAAPNTMNNPQVGTKAAPPKYTAGQTKSPQFLPDEKSYFSQVRQTLEQAKPGDIVCAQMYEFENAATNGDKDAATKAPGYADQQAILPDLAAAAKRGVNVQVVLDASQSKETKDLQNRPVANYLINAGKQTGNLTVDFYPPNTVNIDHAKELVHLSKGTGGNYQVESAIAGGSNWGNHTPANDDGGGVFYGKDAVGAADIFFRDQAFCRGDTTSAAEPHNDPNAPVQWHVTAPTAEGGGSTAIRDQKEALTQQADSVYMNQFCLTEPSLLKEVEAKGANAHVRLDPNEFNVNKSALADIRAAGGQAMWANTDMDPNMEGQKNHEKLDVYTDKQGQAFAASLGSANDTGNGLETTHSSPNPKTGAMTSHKTNHEIDAFITRTTDGNYSTAPFLDAALAKTQNDLANRSLENPPHNLSSTNPGNF